MSDLAATATRLRNVRQATRDFLALYALDNLRDRVEAQRGKGPLATIGKVEAERRLADPDDHDWSLLYRGSVLDD